MRNLTVLRRKRFVGSMCKMKLYVENPVSGDTMINNVPCSKIGDLKNGEQKTFQISDDTFKLYVISDKLTKNYCNEFYQIPAGQDDVFLSGQNEFNPASGNAFRFDGFASDEVLANRKRGSKIGLIVLIASVLIGAIVGFTVAQSFIKGSKDKTFTVKGMNITLTDDFQQETYENYTVAFQSNDVAILALKEPFSSFDGFEDYTLKEYAKLVIDANGCDNTELNSADGLLYFEHEFYNSEYSTKYHYYDFVYKSNDSFWLIQFFTTAQNQDKYEKQIISWAKSIKFN